MTVVIVGLSRVSLAKAASVAREAQLESRLASNRKRRSIIYGIGRETGAT